MLSVRRSGRTAERRPTPSPRSAPLPLCPRRACSLELTRRRRASAEPRARRSLSAPPTLSSAHRSCRRAQRAPSWPHRRAPTDVILTFRSVAAPPSPRLFTRTDTTTASERRAASTSFCLRAADLVERAPIAPRWTRRAPFWPVITVFICPIASHWLKCKLMCERAGTSNSLPTFTPKTDQAKSACRDFRCAPLRSASLRFAPLRSCFAPLRPLRSAFSSGSRAVAALGRSESHATATMRPVPLRRSAPLVSPYSRSAFFPISTSAPTCHSTRASHPTDARRSRSHCSPPRVIRSRGTSFSLSVEGRPRARLCRLYWRLRCLLADAHKYRRNNPRGLSCLVISQERNGPVWRPSDGALLFGT